MAGEHALVLSESIGTGAFKIVGTSLEAVHHGGVGQGHSVPVHQDGSLTAAAPLPYQVE